MDDKSTYVDKGNALRDAAYIAIALWLFPHFSIDVAL